MSLTKALPRPSLLMLSIKLTPFLLALGLPVHASLLRTSYREAAGKFVLQDNITDQVNDIRAILPADVQFNITLISPNASIWSSETMNPLTLGCITSIPLPPNTEDCIFLANTVSNLNTTIDLPSSACSWISYRSCLMYKCATPCEGFSFDTGEWSQVVEDIRWICVQDKGESGFYQRLSSKEEDLYPYIAGVEHIGGKDNKRMPIFWPCVVKKGNV